MVASAAVATALASVVASIAFAAAPRPAPLEALEKRSLTIIGTLPNSAGLSAYAAYMGAEPVALYVTPDGKHVIAGTLFDAAGKDLTADVLEKTLAKATGQRRLGPA